MEEQQVKRKNENRTCSIVNFTQGVAFTLLLLAIGCLFYFVIAYRERVIPITNYAIVFDAGSSHTEMYIYHWPADKSEGLGTTSSVNQYHVCGLTAIRISDASKPNETIKLKAISDFEVYTDSLMDYFAPCLKEAVEKIPSERHKFSPVFLGATAGMRLSKLRNITRANAVLEKIREIFLSYPFQFVTARQVRVLTGTEEAIDGWITTNILLEKFRGAHAKRKQQGQQTTKDEFDKDMVGVLDLGGASTQVTFTYKHEENESIPDEFTTNITLFDTTYDPYAHSYLCWGKNEASKRYRARLLNTALNVGPKYTQTSSNILVRDPCLIRGINETVSVSSIFRSACTANEKQQFNNSINISSLTFIGMGNATKCHERLRSLFDSKRNDKTVNCSFKQEYCTFDHTFQPKIPENIHFIGLSGYYYVFNNLVHGMEKPPNSTSERYRMREFPLQKLQQRLVNVCETHYNEFYKQEDMNPSNEQHKRALCFDAWYVWLLLTYGIGFDEKSLQRVNFANSLPTGKVGWTLGYMINQTNYIPAEFRESSIKKHHFISWVTVASIVALIASVFLLVTCQTILRRILCKRTTMTTGSKDDYTQPPEQATA